MTQFAEGDRAISLNAAIDAMSQCIVKEVGYEQNNQAVNNCIAELSQLPSITSSRLTGHWEDKSPISWICSKCGYQVQRYNNTDFCPHCGAKMVESQESEEV